MQTETENGILYKPDHVKNPYIGTIWFGFIIISGIYFLIDGLKKINTIGGGKYLAIIIGLVPAMLMFGYLISLTFIITEYITLTDKTLIGKNRWKKQKGEIRFDEIEAIYVKGKSYFIRIRDIHGHEIKINPPDRETIEMMSKIIEKAVNCKKIDIRYIRNKFMGISVYEKGIAAKK